MNDRRYLLSIKELLDGPESEQLAERACKKLDRERLKKLQGISRERKHAECIGAGLLLQLGLQEIGMGNQGCCVENVTSDDEVAEDVLIQPVTVTQLLERLDEAVEPEYTYGENGKPYFKNFPVYFSLSHSGEYVFCVFSEKEVGADIQYKKPNACERVVKRFFAEPEREAWENCGSREERETLFYKLWTRKEAYGKLTGEGIVAATAVNVLEESRADEDLRNKLSDVSWEDYDILDNYYISICKQAGEKE